MLTAEVHPADAWPRVRALDPDRCVVQGHATRVLVWLALRHTARIGTGVLGLWILGAALVGSFAELYESLRPSNPLAIAMAWMIELRWVMHRLMTQWLPGLGEALWYNPRSPVDWHLLVVMILYWRLRPVLAYALATWCSHGLRPLLGRRFKLSFSPEAVVIHRRLRSLRLSRLDHTIEAVTFRVVDRSHLPGLLGWLNRMGWLRPTPDTPCPVVMAVCGRRMIPIATPPYITEAHAIVESCLLALHQTRP